MPTMRDLHTLKLRLGKPTPFAAVLVDAEGEPIAGAKVQVEAIGHVYKQGSGATEYVGVRSVKIDREVVEDTPTEGLFVAATDAKGAFTFNSLRSGGVGLGPVLKLIVTDADGRTMRVRSRLEIEGRVRRSMEDQGFVASLPGESARLVAIPVARLEGRVVTKLPGVSIARLHVISVGSLPPGEDPPLTDTLGVTRTDADGRFAFEDMAQRTIGLAVAAEGANADWTYRMAEDVELIPGKTSEVTLELIRGVEVEGTVVVQGTRVPVAKALVGAYDPNRPRTNTSTRGVKTDDRGRYRLRLPPGETTLYVRRPPIGFSRLPGDGSRRTVIISDGASPHRVPPIEVAPDQSHGPAVNATRVPLASTTAAINANGASAFR